MREPEMPQPEPEESDVLLPFPPSTRVTRFGQRLLFW
jgi:hypothetical protein